MRRSHKEILRSLIPSIVFLIVYRFYNFKTALVIGILTGIVIYTSKYKKEGKLTSFDFLGIFGLIVQTAVGFVALNEFAYFIYPAVQNAVFSIIFFGSLLTKKDVVTYIAKDYEEKTEDEIDLVPTYRRITSLWGLYYFIKTLVKIFGMMNWSFELLYSVNWVLGTPISLILMYISFSYPNKVYEKLKNEMV